MDSSNSSSSITLGVSLSWSSKPPRSTPYPPTYSRRGCGSKAQRCQQTSPSSPLPRGPSGRRAGRRSFRRGPRHRSARAFLVLRYLEPFLKIAAWSSWDDWPCEISALSLVCGRPSVSESTRPDVIFVTSPSAAIASEQGSRRPAGRQSSNYHLRATAAKELCPPMSGWVGVRGDRSTEKSCEGSRPVRLAIGLSSTGRSR